MLPLGPLKWEKGRKKGRKGRGLGTLSLLFSLFFLESEPELVREV